VFHVFVTNASLYKESFFSVINSSEHEECRRGEETLRKREEDGERKKRRRNTLKNTFSFRRQYAMRLWCFHLLQRTAHFFLILRRHSISNNNVQVDTWRIRQGRGIVHYTFQRNFPFLFFFFLIFRYELWGKFKRNNVYVLSPTCPCEVIQDFILTSVLNNFGHSVSRASLSGEIFFKFHFRLGFIERNEDKAFTHTFITTLT